MSDLISTINQKLVESLKAKDGLTTSVFRLLKSAIGNKRIEVKRELKEEEILVILQSQVKSRKDAAEQFGAGGRLDLKEKEEKEIVIIKKLLPEDLSEEELKEIVEKAVKEAKAESPKDMGKVMGIAIKEVKGRASGEVVKEAVLKILQ
jgi:uncharacterized protein YqeY